MKKCIPALLARPAMAAVTRSRRAESKSRWVPALIVCSVISSTACNKPDAIPAAKAPPQVVAPVDGGLESAENQSAGEVLDLGAECARQGAKIMENSAIGFGLMRDQASHYDPRGSHCYVQLTIQNADSSMKRFSTYLFDGQSQEMLAFAEKDDGKVTFRTPLKDTKSYDDAIRYIASKMADEDDYR